MNIAIAIFIGLLTAMNGVSYKIASYGRVQPIQSSTVLAFFAIIVYGILGHDEWSVITPSVAIWSLVFGTTQYLALRFLNTALRLGPLSPAWCAISLNFIVVILYSSCFLGETMSLCQILSLACTVCAVVTASFSANGGQQKTSLKNCLLYDIILVATLVSASLINVGLKYYSATSFQGHDDSVTDCCGRLMMLFIYVGIFIPSCFDLSVKHGWRWNRYALIGGAMLSVGAILTYWLIITCISSIPTITLFATSNTVALLGTALVSVLFMHEKKTWSWAMTLAFSLLAVLLNQ